MKNEQKKYYLGLEGELLEEGDGYPVRVAFIGCGSHAFRNIYPCLRYLSVELVAVCDTNKEKAEQFKRQFGANTVYTDYKEMLDHEKLDAVLVVVGFGEDGEPLYMPIIKEILQRGIPVWFEKPPTNNAQKIKEMIEYAKQGKTFAQVGFKKMFMPSIDKVREIINSEEFGKISSYTLRYPVDLPEDIRDIEKAGPRRFLDDFMHVASTIISVVGRPDYIFYKRSNTDSAIVTLVHNSGHIGSLHLCPKASEMCPLEQLEIVGDGANIVLNNNIEVIYYPPAKRLPYGRTTSFIPSNGRGAEYFTPEFSLGQLYNKGLFLLGYVDEVKEFIQAVHDGREPRQAGLKDALAVMQLYDAFAGKEGEYINLDDASIRTGVLNNSKSTNKNPVCPNCQELMFLKDGWNFSCKKCGRMLASSELI